jgi:hypothetical protein
MFSRLVVVLLLLCSEQAVAADGWNACSCYSGYPDQSVSAPDSRIINMCGVTFDLRSKRGRQLFSDDLVACGVKVDTLEHGSDGEWYFIYQSRLKMVAHRWDRRTVTALPVAELAAASVTDFRNDDLRNSARLADECSSSADIPSCYDALKNASDSDRPWSKDMKRIAHQGLVQAFRTTESEYQSYAEACRDGQEKLPTTYLAFTAVMNTCKSADRLASNWKSLTQRFRSELSSDEVRSGPESLGLTSFYGPMAMDALNQRADVVRKQEAAAAAVAKAAVVAAKKKSLDVLREQSRRYLPTAQVFAMTMVRQALLNPDSMHVNRVSVCSSGLGLRKDGGLVGDSARTTNPGDTLAWFVVVDANIQNGFGNYIRRYFPLIVQATIEDKRSDDVSGGKYDASMVKWLKSIGIDAPREIFYPGMGRVGGQVEGSSIFLMGGVADNPVSLPPSESNCANDLRSYGLDIL